MEKLAQFYGLNNVTDPLRLGLGWLSAADNVNITDTGALTRRSGYAQVNPTAMAGAFATRDGSRMYAASGDTLYRVSESMTLQPVVPLLSTASMYWAEMNRQVFFNNGVDRGIIMPDGELRPWAWTVPDAPRLTALTGTLPAGLYRACCTTMLADGRETGASSVTDIVLQADSALGVSDIPQIPGCTTRLYIAPANSTVFQLASASCGVSFTWGQSPDNLGEVLTDRFLSPVPEGADVIQHWYGRMYAAQYMPQAEQTVVWMSEPLAPHLFDLHGGFFVVPGQVRALAPTDSALLVCTEATIYAYSEEKLTILAPYGVPSGEPWAYDDDTNGVLLWTTRGVCSAMPFKNITQDYVSVAPGLQAGAALIRSGGEKRFVATLQSGGSAFNQRL